MKSIYTVIAFTLFAFAGQAQTFAYSTDQHIDEINYSGSYETYDIKFKTANPQEITYEWTRISNSMPVDWTYSLCDYTNCYIGVPPSGTMTTISLQDSQNGVEGFFKLTLSPQGISGEGLIELYVYDSANPASGDTVSFHITYTEGVGVSELSSTEFTLYPNPASEKITVHSANGTETFKGVVFNALGQSVFSIETSNGMNETINVNSWDKGVYFLRIESESGEATTKKFIVD